MVISHRHKFLYFVIPKTASATLRKSLEPFVDVGWPVTTHPQHVTIAAFQRSDYVGLFADYLKFTCVRNPYDRLYSGYLQDRYAAEHYPRWTKVKKPVFDAIGDDFPTYFNEHAMQADIETDWEWICFCPMTAFATGPDGELVMDFVGRAETLDQDISTLAGLIGAPITKAPDVNVRQGRCGTRPKYLEHFDRRTLAAVNEVYRRDFELFGYEMIDPADLPSR